MKLNCDMGESFGSWSKGMDADVMPYIDMANIACGYHASDPQTMDYTVQLAQQSDVMVGAHPGYPDLLGFGRRDMVLSADELRLMTVYQLAALDGICRVNGTSIQYVKPHGALYNRMMVDEATLGALMQAVAGYSRDCPLVVMATPEADAVRRLADRHGIEVWFEAFSDRAYDDSGRLANRSIPGAVHKTTEAIEAQVLQIIEEGAVTSLGGHRIPICADTICIHGDSEHAVAAARHIRAVVGA
ncbi:5-oxoprolinase subunit PxpA [Marinobacterium marinum]|uniref:5-oxoprolinase subunit PxpA n=1 Tax=Marinobacterium marinum TaxID=2756129 RepID=A0A7W2ACZ3_9GAMM|nr:5-oxoprolinase subunit PxpA [Marinobacterium marinum]MBA4503024.1 5-oxoprolinase subunit PxpA [Marinobacterium marinum]